MGEAQVLQPGALEKEDTASEKDWKELDKPGYRELPANKAQVAGVLDEMSESLEVKPPKGNPKQFTRNGVTFYRGPDGKYYTVPDSRPDLIYHDGFTFRQDDANVAAKEMWSKDWYRLTEYEKKRSIEFMAKNNRATPTRINPDDSDRIPIQTAGGRAETRYNRAYEEAPSHGIFGSKEKAEFASRKSSTQSEADVHYKRNVRAWVGAAKDALRSNDRYRIAETAREVPYPEPGTEGVSEHLGISQHIAQANVSGQHIEQSIAIDDERKYKEHRKEFASIVDTIDAQTKNWPE